MASMYGLTPETAPAVAARQDAEIVKMSSRTRRKRRRK
jgi:hypothetical protein